jgi:hypothetical protein
VVRQGRLGGERGGEGAGIGTGRRGRCVRGSQMWARRVKRRSARASARGLGQVGPEGEAPRPCLSPGELVD